MNKFSSQYYPPRAKWYSPVFQLGNSIRRRMYLDRINLPAGVSVGDIFKSLLWPGIGFCVRGEILTGIAIGCASALLAVIFVIWLGYPAANVAFGLFVSAHVTSLLFMLNPLLATMSLRSRLAFAVGVLLFIGCCIYIPIRNQFQARYLRPLRMNGNVVVVQRFSSSTSVRRGDWVAYSLPTVEVENVRVRDGLGLGPVLAVSGDQIRFTTNAFEVNGISRPLLPNMPMSGELLMPEKHWFVWPALDITTRGHIGEISISAAMLQLASVPETNYIGKPFKHWFWRQQILQ